MFFVFPWVLLFYYETVSYPAVKGCVELFKGYSYLPDGVQANG